MTAEEQQTKPRNIKSITQKYDTEEDRIRLTALDSEGATMRLWLTQRLGSRLVKSLTNWLEQEMANSGEKAASLQSWEQSAAQAQFSGGSPVKEETVAVEGLLHSIDLARRAGIYRITFKWQGQEAVLPLSTVELRQWLAILYRVYQGAGWPMNVWPTWLNPKTAQTEAQKLALH